MNQDNFGTCCCALGSCQLEKARPEVTQVGTMERGARVDYVTQPVCCQGFLGGVRGESSGGQRTPVEGENSDLHSQIDEWGLFCQHSEERQQG